MTVATEIAYRQSGATREQAEGCLLAAFAYLGIPGSMLDLGCGPGHLCLLADGLGVTADGVDLHAPELEHPMLNGGSLDRTDLTEPWRGDPRGYDLVLCLEVAEHLPPSAAGILCSTVHRATKPGGILLWSAATPGQGGSGHLNEMPHEYWEGRLIDLGFTLDTRLTPLLRRVWLEVAPSAWWYGRNVMAFRGLS